MRTFYSNKSLSINPLRQRILSMQASQKKYQPAPPAQDIIQQRMEKQLNKELEQVQFPRFDLQQTLPEAEQKYKIENKLWKYFVNRIRMVQNKVQKQRLNFCERELKSIKEQVIRRKAANTLQLSHLEESLRDLNRQIHDLFEEIRDCKGQQLVLKNILKNKRRKGGQNLPKDPSQDIYQLKERVTSKRVELTNIESTIQHLKGELIKIEEEWKSFLKHFLSEGFYFQDGVSNVLKEMAEISYTPQKADFPVFLDDTTKNCLILQYQRLRVQYLQQQNDSKKATIIPSESRHKFKTIVKRSNLQKIYEGTQDYMKDWVRKQGWKQDVNLPTLQSVQLSSSRAKSDWRSQERKRLIFIDDKDRYKKVKAFLFGSKVETIS